MEGGGRVRLGCMSRPCDSGRLDLAELFHRAQQEMLAQLHVGGLIEHGPTAGAATERHWIALFERYLPKRYKAASAFVIDSRGNRSRQIDIAIYDHFYSPLLFPQESACGEGGIGSSASQDLGNADHRGQAPIGRTPPSDFGRVARG